MGATRFESILGALEQAGIRYVVAGGFAVNLHGFLRFTKDLDILLDLAPDNAARAMRVLSDLGLRPRLPVDMLEFADANAREDWVQHRNMLVFQIWHPGDPLCSVDVFVRNPIGFDVLWDHSVLTMLGTTPCRIVGIEDLISMKTQAGRPQDLRDIEALRSLLQLGGS